MSALRSSKTLNQIRDHGINKKQDLRPDSDDPLKTQMGA